MKSVPAQVREAFDLSAKFFPTPLQSFQFYDKYSRYSYKNKRRETWIETVDRATDYLKELSENKLTEEEYDKIRQFILEMKATPSMRLLAMAGDAARRQNIAIFNCSAAGISSIDSFVETLIIAMAGCGTGFSVERKYVDQLPTITPQSPFTPGVRVHVIADTTEGWADALRNGITSWFNGSDVAFDYSQIRPAGAPLKTKGGQASGYLPLKNLLDFTREKILSAQGRKLTPLEVHDIVCKIGEVVVSGGVRRCLKKGTLVHLRRGLTTIEDVVVGDEVMTDIGYKPVVDSLYQGIQDIVEIKTETGMSLFCTPDHRVAVLNDVFGGYIFKQAQELLPSDRLLFITHPIMGEQQSLHPLPEKREADHSGSRVTQPTLNINTAWFLGKFLADGYVQLTEQTEKGKQGNTQFSVSCHKAQTTVIAKVISWFKDHGLVPNISYGDGNWLNIRSGNRQIARWMSGYKKPNQTLHIPKEILTSPQDIRWSFLAGVADGDGCFSDRPFTIASTVYKEFAEELIQLLASLGVVSEIRLRRPQKGIWKPLWVVTVKDSFSLDVVRQNFDLYTGSIIPERKQRQNGYTIPKSFICRDLKKTDFKLKYNPSSERGMNHHTCSDITGKKHFVPISVLSVSSAGQDETYDISVEDQHVFVAEGYLVHNTASISLFDYNDEEMRNCKNGDITGNEQRWMANNSAVWPNDITDDEIRKQMREMDAGQRGEPGIFNRKAANIYKPDRREPADFLTNPCAEIWLLDREFCNLSICVARPNDTSESLKEKVEVATIIGTIQSMATNFPGLRQEWVDNCQRERLLGVDINGQLDCPLLINDDGSLMRELRDHAVEVNKIYAERLGINQSAAVTCVKPSGNSSQLFNCSSGLHARWAPYYIRRVRISANSPLFRVLKDAGVPLSPENGQTARNATTWVASFPVKSPEGAIVKQGRSAIEQCEYWLKVKKNWTEHNPSCTITYHPEEFTELTEWVVAHKDWIGGMSFLPASDAKYEQMPYEEIDESRFHELASQFPADIDFSRITLYEKTDTTESAQLVACQGGSCDL